MCAFNSPPPSLHHISPRHTIFKVLCLISFTTLLFTSCIHTYPTPEESINPTEIGIEMTVEFAEDWSNILTSLSENSSDDTRAESWPRRLYLELTGGNGKKEKLTRVIEPQEITDGSYTFTLPFKLKAEEYTISLWSDYLDPETLQPLGYDISRPELIKELVAHGEETQKRLCLTATDKLNLKHLAGKWDVTENVTFTLTPPVARFRLVATDYEDFMEYTEQSRRQGEKYYVTLSYDSDIPGAFSMSDGIAMEPTKGIEFTTPILSLNIPGIEMSIASDWLFNPPGRHSHTVSIVIFNSAKAIVSQTEGINIPMERGKITTVSGRFLTNFITGGIQIDNIWAGEIIIEID